VVGGILGITIFLYLSVAYLINNVINVRGYENGKILIFPVVFVTTFLLLYFVTVVLVYLRVLRREWALVKFIEGCFHYCFAIPATFITLSLLGARKEYSHDDNGGWDELGGRLKSKDQVAILRLDKKLDQLQKQQDGDSARLDKTLDQLQKQQRQDFEELQKQQHSDSERRDKKLDQLQKQQHSDSARLNKTLDRLEKQQRSDCEHLDKTLDRIQRQQRRDFVELRNLLEEREVKRQEDTLDND
jgi:hypothetical protein